MRRLIFLSALTLGFSAVSHADTVSNFSIVNETFQSGATSTGTVTIDTTTGVFTFVNSVYKLGSNVISFVGAPTVQSSFDNGTQYYEYTLNSQTNPQDALLIGVPGASLVGYAGSKLCSLSTPCDGYTSYFTDVNGVIDRNLGGSLAATPEPSSIALLGTGLLGMCGYVRRRFTNSNA